MMTRKFCLYDRFFVSNQNFTTEHVKLPGFSRFLFKIPGFPGFFFAQTDKFQVFQCFQVKWQPCHTKKNNVSYILF